MKVAVINFCSARADMLAFSSKMLMTNAGHDDFDYFVVTWLPTPEVVDWLKQTPLPIIRVDFPTVHEEYVPQLRALMNSGFDLGYRYADWVCVVNTDMAFGRNWLGSLVREAVNPTIIPNSTHITPVEGTGNVVKGNFGVPTQETFDLAGFWKTHDELWTPGKVESQDERPGGWEACATFPYLLHRHWWATFGPWKLRYEGGGDAPDRAFFRRCYEAGARYLLVGDSIVYHHEAVERRGARPPGAEGMPEGA